MSNTIRMRIAKLEGQPRAVVFRPAVWRIATLLRTELRAMAARASPAERAAALEILQVSVDRQKTLADVSTPALQVLISLLKKRLAEAVPAVQDHSTRRTGRVRYAKTAIEIHCAHPFQD